MGNHRESMSKVDTAWLRMEQPTNLMMITGVVGLEAGLDFERLLHTIEQRLLAFRRFRQRTVIGPSGAFWEDDPDFELENHVRRVALPGDKDYAELQRLVSDLASSPLDPCRPLWQFHVVESVEGRPALICRFHHCIADGIALVQVFLSLTDTRPEGRPSADDPDTWRERRSSESSVFRRLTRPARAGLGAALDLGQKALDEGQRMLDDPGLAVEYAGEASDILAELVHSLTLPADPVTRFSGRLGVRKEAAWADPLPLDEVKAVARAFGCTVNDVLIAAVTGSLRHYLLRRGDSIDDELEIRATVPVNLRPLEHAKELGNHFGLVFLSLPLGADNPLERLYAVNERMVELKSSKQAAVAFGLLATLGVAPSWVQGPALNLLSEKATTVLTNVPGPQQPLFLAGTRVRDMMFWVPQSGGIGMGISILSYDGQVFFGVMSDRRLVSEPDEIVGRVRHEFEKMLYLGLMLPLEGAPSPATAEYLLERVSRT